jgi:hypothetical protein
MKAPKVGVAAKKASRKPSKVTVTKVAWWRPRNFFTRWIF